jgi:TMEM175 potassium channel family protein
MISKIRATDAKPAPAQPAAGMDSRRVEAFSDGVFAIAITLLVLDLTVPSRAQLHGGSLAAALGHGWPSYAAYLVSFLIIGIIWVNHHSMFTAVRRVDRPALFTNLVLLLFVSVLPFPTRLLAEYLTAARNSHIAAAVYSVNMFVMGAAFTALWLMLTRDNTLVHEHIDARASRKGLRRFSAGLAIYLATIGLSFISAPATLAVHGALALYYCFDQLPITLREGSPEDP